MSLSPALIGFEGIDPALDRAPERQNAADEQICIDSFFFIFCFAARIKNFAKPSPYQRVLTSCPSWSLLAALLKQTSWWTNNYCAKNFFFLFEKICQSGMCFLTGFCWACLSSVEEHVLYQGNLLFTPREPVEDALLIPGRTFLFPTAGTLPLTPTFGAGLALCETAVGTLRAVDGFPIVLFGAETPICGPGLDFFGPVASWKWNHNRHCWMLKFSTSSAFISKCISDVAKIKDYTVKLTFCTSLLLGFLFTAGPGIPDGFGNFDKPEAGNVRLLTPRGFTWKPENNLLFKTRTLGSIILCRTLKLGCVGWGTRQISH